MARSRRYKLLWSPDSKQRQFFDLETDPHENLNLIDDVNLAATIAQHCAALANWAMFAALPPNCLEPLAPLAPGANLPVVSHEDQQQWSENKFAEFLRQ